MKKDDLIQFENEIAKLFNAGKIRAPIHLYHGNEKEIIKIFKNIKSKDWVFCSWRSHYQCLLKGVPKKLIKDEIVSQIKFKIETFKPNELPEDLKNIPAIKPGSNRTL